MNPYPGFQPGYAPTSQGSGSNPGQGTNPYPGFQPGYTPLFFPVGGGGQPEPSDPLYTSPADGPELKLIGMQLTGEENYMTRARDLRCALVTKDKDDFLNGAVPFLADKRLQRQ